MIEYEGQKYLDTNEVMKELKIKSRQSIYDFILNDYLHPVTFSGNKNYFLASEVRQLKALRSTPKPKNYFATARY